LPEIDISCAVESYVSSLSLQKTSLCHLLADRYGTVETAPKVELGSRVPGRHLALRTRKYLVWLHLALINGISIGESRHCLRLALCHHVLPCCNDQNSWSLSMEWFCLQRLLSGTVRRSM
jgi:hypothetical protein